MYEPGASARVKVLTTPFAVPASRKCSTQHRLTQAGASRLNPARRMPSCARIASGSRMSPWTATIWGLPLASSACEWATATGSQST